MFSSAEVPKYVSEFVGTYVLVLTVGCNVLGGTAIWAVTSIAFALMIGIYALGDVSGAHFNPAVTLALKFSDQVKDWSTAITYIVSQLAGALAAGFTYVGIFGASFDLGPGKGYSWMGAGVVEMLYTCMLCFVVLNVACAKASEGNQYFGLAIGGVIIAGGYAVGTVSGGAFNPAVALAIDVSSHNKGFGMFAIYSAFQIAGAFVASALFKVVRAEQFGGVANTLQSKLIAEAVGTFFLTATVGFNVLTASAAGAWSIAAALMAMVYAVGNVSGGHFNPAVTLAVFLRGGDKISSQDAIKYAGAQIAGAIAASLTYVGVLGLSFRVAPGMGWFKTGIAEIVFTALLCFTVLSVATVAKPSKDMFGFIIGSVITVAGFAGASLGVVLNPAVGVGIDFANMVKGGHFGGSLGFAVLEAAGAALAVGLFKTVRPDESGEVKGKTGGKAGLTASV